MAELSVTLPEARPDDAEDVVWGLSTARTLWARGERRDAVVWLRRAAEAAESSGNVFRASELGMYAQELDDALNAAASDAPRPPLPSFDIEFDANTGTPPPAHVRPAIAPPAPPPLPPMAPPPVPPQTTPHPPSAVPATARPPSMAPPPLPSQSTAPAPGSLRPPPPPSVTPPAAPFVASPSPSVPPPVAAPQPPPVAPLPPPVPEGDLLAPPSRPPSVRPPPRSVTPPPMPAATTRPTTTPPPGPGKAGAQQRKVPLRSPILDPWSEGDPQSANLPRGEEPAPRRKTATGESSASLARPRVAAVLEDQDVITSAAPLEQTLGRKRAVPPPLPGGTALAAPPPSTAAHAPPKAPPPPPVRASSPANPAVAPPPAPASVRPPVPPQPPSVRPPPPPTPVVEAPNEAAAPPPPPVPAAPEPAPPAAPAPAAEANASGEAEPAAAPQPGQLAAQAATVPQKQAPRTPSVPPKAPAPAAIHKTGGPATTPSPPVVEPRPEPKTQPPVIKGDAPPPEATKVTIPKPAPGGISPAARRALSDTLQSPIAASALRVPKPPAVATQPVPEKEPAAAAPPPAKTVPAVPEAVKRSGTTMPPPAPPRPAAAATAGRAALAALKPDAAQPVAEAPKPAPAPAAAAVEPAPNSSGPPRIGDVMLEAIEPLTDLPEDVQRALSRAAKIEALGPGQSRALGVMLVIAGEVSVYATDATVPGHVAGPRSFLTSRGSFEGGFSMRFVTGASGAKIASWDDATFDHALRSCPWVLDDCKATADRLQARAGLALDALGGLDAKIRDDLATRLDMRVIEPGEIVTQENDPMPGLIFVVGGGVDIQEGEPSAVVGEARAGELLFADALWAGVPAPLTSRAKASGALLLVADRKRALELAADVPLVAELLSR